MHADTPPLKARSSLALTVLLTVTVAACERQQSQPAAEKSPIEAESSVASRTVFADELLWAMGPKVRERVVAVSPMADDARYSTVGGQWSPQIPRLGQNPEQLLTLAPGLVILSDFSAPEYRAALEGKVEVLTLGGFDGFDAYLHTLERVGEALAEPERAAELAAAFTQRRAELEQRRPSERPSVVSWGHGYVAGANTTFDDAARTAGFTNLAADQGVQGHARLDTEQLVVWSPRWLVIGCGEQPCEAAVAALREQPGVAKLDAVLEGRVIAIEAPYLSTTGADMLELSARMQARLLEAGSP